MPFPSRRRRLRAPLAAALALAALPALAADPAVHRVSDPGIANSGVAQSPPEDQPRFSPDGKWAVWAQDAEIINAWNLYAARRWEGSTPARLSAAYAAGQGVAAFAITPDSQRVVYLAGSFSTGLYQLWSVPIDGSSAPVRLNPTPPANGGVTGFEIAPNGSRVVFRGDLPTDGEFALWSVPVAGPSGQAVQLSPAPQVAGSDVNAFVITADSQRAIYDGVLRNNAVDELWSSPLAGGTVARLNPQLAGAFGVDPSPEVAFRSSSDGSRVLYVGDFRTPGRFELFTVPAAGPATSAAAISVTAVPQGNVAEFQIASGTPKVVFSGDLLVAGTVQLWASAVDGSGTPVRLSHASPVTGGNVTGFAIAAGASPRVLFRGDAFVDERYDLYQVPIAGGGPTRLNSVSVATGDVETDFAIAPDGSAVVFRGNLNSADKIELYSAATDGASGSAQRISPSSTPTGANVDAFALDSTSTTVVFAGDVSTDGRTELWSVPIAGPASSGLRLHPAPGANQNVTAFALSPGGVDVAFVADLVVDQRFDLWWAPLAGPAATAPVAVTAVAGGNVELPLVWADDGYGVLFLGDLETDQRFPLWDADILIFRADFEGDDTAEWSSVVP